MFKKKRKKPVAILSWTGHLCCDRWEKNEKNNKKLQSSRVTPFPHIVAFSSPHQQIFPTKYDVGRITLPHVYNDGEFYADMGTPSPYYVDVGIPHIVRRKIFPTSTNFQISHAIFYLHHTEEISSITRRVHRHHFLPTYSIHFD
jgi:hypothetical protein